MHYSQQRKPADSRARFASLYKQRTSHHIANNYWCTKTNKEYISALRDFRVSRRCRIGFRSSGMWRRDKCNLLTYSMVHSPSWEANWFAASQEIPHILWNPKVHYRTHKRPPPVPIPDQPNSVHIPTSYLLGIHPNIIHPPTLRSPQWSLSLRFPHQDPTHPLSSPTRATCPAHLILLDFITRTISVTNVSTR